MKEQQVRQILAEKGSAVHSIEPTATVAAAVAKMNDERIGSLLVMKGRTPIGIFTERDVLTRVVAERRDPDTTLVNEVMTSQLAIIGPSSTVEDAMIIITERRCRHLPVIEGGQLLGMISIGDVTRWMIHHQRREIDDLVSYITWG